MKHAKRTDWWQFTGEVAMDAALVLEAAGHRDEARAAAQQAASLFEGKGQPRLGAPKHYWPTWRARDQRD
jgi:hypothetical protein